MNADIGIANSVSATQHSFMQAEEESCPTGCIHRYVTVVGSWHRDIEDDHEGKKRN
jgi:hypothetical protein